VDPEVLAKKLRVMRAERGLSLRKAAKVTGVDMHTLSYVERGERRPYDTTLAKIAKAYGVPVSELVGDPAVPLGGAA
jgi:transcriptional regulator with XRE-family HTH domain